MDETSLRTLFDRAVSERPPAPRLVPNALRSGRRMRRRRNLLAAAAVVIAVGLIAGLIPLVHGLVASPARPVTPGHSTGGETLYVETVHGLVPVSVATGTAGQAIPLQALSLADAGPGAHTVYGLSNSALTPVDTAAGTAGAPIALPSISGRGPVPSDEGPEGGNLAIGPGGRTAYVLYRNGVLPINLVTGTRGRLISVPHAWALALTPNGRMLYVIQSGSATTWSATPVNTATGAALRPIRLGQATGGFLSYPVVAPNGRTIVLCATENYQTHLNPVITIDTATKSARRLSVAGLGGCDGEQLAPDGDVVYVAGQNEVVPVDIATNTALTPIGLPSSVDHPLTLALGGRTLYAFGWSDELMRIDTATGKALKPIGLGVPDPDRNLLNGVLAIGPNGTAYVTSALGLMPVNTVTGTAGRPINVHGAILAVVFAR